MLSNKSIGWRWLMFAAACGYLLLEIVFNGLLIDIAGTDRRQELFRDIEVFGRYLSAAGFALLVADFLIRSTSFGRSVLYFIPIFGVSWLIGYQLQVYFIDHYLANSSTPSERRIATGAFWINNAVIEDTLKIKGIEVSGDINNTPSEKTFLTLLGGLAFVDDEFLSSLDKSKEVIVRKYIEKVTYDDFEDYYTSYATARDKVVQQFRDYENALNPMYDAMGDIPQEAADAYDKSEEMVDGLWKIYQQQQEYYWSQLDKFVYRYHYKLGDYIKTVGGDQSKVRIACRRKPKCLARYKEVWDRRFMTKLELRKPIPIEHFFVKNDRGEEVYGTSKSYLRGRLDAWGEVRSKFTSQANKYPPTIQSYEEFRNHPRTAVIVRYRMGKRGLELPKSWKVGDRRQFITSAAKSMQKKIENNFKSKVSSNGTKLGTDVTWYQFQRLDSVQEGYRELMGEFYRKPVMSTWNNKLFDQKIIKPYINSETEDAIVFIDASDEDFADGGEYEQMGKDMYLSVIIPPIAMALSLILSLITVMKLATVFIGLTLGRMEYLSLGTMKVTRIGQVLCVIVISIGIINIPKYTNGNDLIRNNSKVWYFIDAFNNSVPPMASRSLEWVMNVQPVVYPLARSLEKNMNIFDLDRKTDEIIEKRRKNNEKTNKNKRVRGNRSV